MIAEIRFGIVKSIDAGGARVRVHFDDEDVVSGWLQVLQTGVGTSAQYAMPSIGDQVVCIYEKDAEQGVCVGAIYSDVQEPAVSGAGVRYIRFGAGSVKMAAADASVEIVAGGGVEITGNVKITGTLEVTGIVTAAGYVP